MPCHSVRLITSMQTGWSRLYSQRRFYVRRCGRWTVLHVCSYHKTLDWTEVGGGGGGGLLAKGVCEAQEPPSPPLSWQLARLCNTKQTPYAIYQHVHRPSIFSLEIVDSAIANFVEKKTVCGQANYNYTNYHAISMILIIFRSPFHDPRPPWLILIFCNHWSAL